MPGKRYELSQNPSTEAPRTHSLQLTGADSTTPNAALPNEEKKLRVPENSIARFFAQGNGDRKAVFRNIEIVAIGVRTASLGIGPSVGARFGQVVWIDLLHPLDDLLAAFDLEAEMVETIGGILFMVRENGEVEVTVGEKDGATLFLAFVQHLHLKDIHIELRHRTAPVFPYPPYEWPNVLA